MRFGRWKLAGAILFLYLEGRSGHQVLPPLKHLSLIYCLPRLPWGSSWAALGQPGRVSCFSFSASRARRMFSPWWHERRPPVGPPPPPPSPKWEVWWCWESNADSQPSSGLQPQPPRFQFILSSPITSCYFHLPFLTACSVDFMLQHQKQKGQPHIDCATISHNCLRSNQIYVFIS